MSKINSRLRYFFLLVLIACNNCIKVLISELGEPVLVFNVYNPDKKIITDFTKMQLLFYANTMFFIGNTRRVFELMISITQIDIALFSIIVEQLVSICTVYFLVSEKKIYTIAADTYANPDYEVYKRTGRGGIKRLIYIKFLN